jgi:hypothetical protein
MSKFAACAQCQRHVRLGDATCPFCGSGTESLVARSFQTPVGAKRAILFALGTSLAAACSEADDPGVQAQPIYGAPIPSETATTSVPGSATAPRASATAPRPSASNSIAAPGVASTGPQFVPVYGAVPVPTTEPVHSSVAPLPTGAQPVYGAPIPSQHADSDGGAPDGDVDGATPETDAGTDAAVDASDWDARSVVAAYGAPPQP